MKITIIYDNETSQPGLEAAWGFSCLVEANGRRLLFDTGGRGEILLKNREALNLDPGSISEISISPRPLGPFGGNWLICCALPVMPGFTFPGHAPGPRRPKR